MENLHQLNSIPPLLAAAFYSAHRDELVLFGVLMPRERSFGRSGEARRARTRIIGKHHRSLHFEHEKETTSGAAGPRTVTSLSFGMGCAGSAAADTELHATRARRSRRRVHGERSPHLPRTRRLLQQAEWLLTYSPTKAGWDGPDVERPEILLRRPGAPDCPELQGKPNPKSKD